MLKTVATDYRWIANPFDKVNPANTTLTVTNVFPIHITTTLPNGLVSRIEKDYDNNLIYTSPGGGTASYGNVTEVREFDYGNGLPGPLIRRTDYTYKAFDGSPLAAAYLAANLVHLVGSVTVYDGSNHQVSNTTYGYDESSLQPSAGSSSITTQHDTSLANPGTRGNLTSVNRWLNTTGGTITTKTAYYDTGTIYQVTDANGNLTTSSYGSGFQSSANFLGAYVTQVQNALQQSTYFDYDFNTGLRTALKDPNAQVSSWDYDLLNRMRHSNAPDGGSTRWDYTDSQPPSFTATSTVTSSLNHIAEADLDGLGRLATTKLNSDPGGVDTVDTSYDSLGRVSTVSNPHRSTASSTDGVTTTYYDALGRVVQVAGPDGTLLPSGTPVTKCQTNNTCTDYSNFPTVTVTDQAGNQRRSRTDALGRLVEVDEPAALGPPTAATGSISISGSEQSTQVLTHAATGSSGTITIAGMEQRVAQSDCPGFPPCYVYDGGTANASVNGGAVVYIDWGQAPPSDAIGIANALASALNSSYGSIVSASASNGVISIASTHTGSGTNYPFSTSIDYDSGDFSQPSFTATASGATLTGGTDNGYSTFYDSGTVSLTIAGCATNPSASYSQSGNNTTSLVASALASSVNTSGCSVTASASGNVITLTATQFGSGVNISFSGNSSTSQGAYFSQPSFSLPSGTVSGGLDHSGGLYTPAVTLYSYDTLGNLTQVQQQGFSSTCDSNCRIRSFQYDSLSRLTSATNPESGKISYNSYDPNGNVLSRTDARGVNTSYSYDALNRLIQKNYSDGTLSTGFYYDQTSNWGVTIGNPVGRLTGIAMGSTGAVLSYDKLGRLSNQWTCLPSNCGSGSYSTAAQYNLAGDLISLTYPSGRQVTFQYNGANALNQVQFASWKGTSVGSNYWSVADSNFYPTGVPKSVSLGNGIVESQQFNNRLQISQDQVVNASIATFAKHTYDYGTKNNGNVVSVSDLLSPTYTQSFTYDVLNRLATASEGRWGLSFVYDAWGNRLQQNLSSGSAGQIQLTVDADNHVQGAPPGCAATITYCYDLSGNLLNDGFHRYVFDAENRITSVDSGAATYTYDAVGQRVRKDGGGNDSIEYVYFQDKPIAEHDIATGAWSDYVYANGKRIAKADSIETRMELNGTWVPAGCTHGCWGGYNFSNAGGLNGYVIQNGDRLFVWQEYLTSGTQAGPNLDFTDGTWSDFYNILDNEGCKWTRDCVGVNVSHYRQFDLSSLAGKTINGAQFSADGQTWAVEFSNYVLVDASGTVHPVYTGEENPSGSMMALQQSVATSTYTIMHDAIPQDAAATTTYYHGDQIGSSRLLTAGSGWPVWQGTFLPYGEEYNVQITNNHYKFTGKERDNETQLDYFGARYYSNGLGRFITPDWAAKATAVPYAEFADPQSLNLYTYVRNNPTTKVDPDGHCDGIGSCWTALKNAVSEYYDKGSFSHSGEKHGDLQSHSDKDGTVKIVGYSVEGSVKGNAALGYVTAKGGAEVHGVETTITTSSNPSGGPGFVNGTVSVNSFTAEASGGVTTFAGLPIAGQVSAEASIASWGGSLNIGSFTVSSNVNAGSIGGQAEADQNGIAFGLNWGVGADLKVTWDNHTLMSKGANEGGEVNRSPTLDREKPK